MAEQFPEKEHAIERTHNQQDKEAVGQLTEDLHSKEFSVDDYSPRRRMSLLDLPLVLALKILQDVIDCYTVRGRWPLELFRLLELRRVHRFFDVELTWLLGRDFGKWDRWDRKACLYQAPTHFVIRILEGCIGVRDRGGREFATQMHSVVDTLMEQCRQLGAPKESGEILQAVCCALAPPPWQHEVYKQKLAESCALLGYKKPEDWNPIPTAFYVAFHARYDDIIKHMLVSIHEVPCDIRANKICRLAGAKSFYIGLPIDMAIASGQISQIEFLRDHGAELDIERWDNLRPFQDSYNLWALEVAARRGHLPALDLVLSWLFSSAPSEEHVLPIVGNLMKMAAKHQQWHIVRPLTEAYARRMNHYDMQEYLDSLLCIAAKCGQDEVVSELLKWVKSPTKGFPLREAAGGGHLSTCKLLLWGESRPDQLVIRQQAEVFARAVAKGGDVEVCQLLRPYRFWGECHEIHFLPIAAELGHLELAKYAVANACDRKPKSKPLVSIIPELNRRVYYPDDLRYFALLRAIISGHQDIVRWMVDELGMDIGSDAELTHPELRPWHLAAHANTCDKLRLALGVDEDVETCDCKEGGEDCRIAAMVTLDRYHEALRLRTDYS
ncbi:hypothetical protein DE146DRAFT_500679 [Phaeosphaeria sp. MPI-PUGE-AT-0046c]|nr:hypothetical protein DE146DRAFT_500679 [Phaeosphaeria sp. MPI-PUGE-AT-0046c]